MSSNWGNQMPGTYSNGNRGHSIPKTMRSRPNAFPIKTYDEPTAPVYHPQEDSLSPKIPSAKTFLNIKLEKQGKTRSNDDGTDAGFETSDTKKNVRRSNSAKVPKHTKKPFELLQSPHYEDRKAPAFGDFSTQSQIYYQPSSNYGHEGPIRDPRYHNISEESNESGVYTNSEKSTGPYAHNVISESDSETLVDPNSLNLNEASNNMATAWEHRNYPVEETVRAKIPAEPIYVNYPPTPRVASSQSDSFLTNQILKLRLILEKIGDVDDIERLHDALTEKENRVYQLGKIVEKLERDNEILKHGLSVEMQKSDSLSNTIKDLTEKNNKLISERVPQNSYNPTPMTGHTNRYMPPHHASSPPIQLPRYSSWNEIPMQQTREPAESHMYPPAELQNFKPCYTSQSDSRTLPHSTPPCGGPVPNVPLNSHFGYPATHN